jgi:hypothetical protein
MASPPWRNRCGLVGRGLDLLTARIGTPNLPDEMVALRGDLILRRTARVAGQSV